MSTTSKLLKAEGFDCSSKQNVGEVIEYTRNQAANKNYSSALKCLSQAMAILSESNDLKFHYIRILSWQGNTKRAKLKMKQWNLNKELEGIELQGDLYWYEGRLKRSIFYYLKAVKVAKNREQKKALWSKVLRNSAATKDLDFEQRILNIARKHIPESKELSKRMEELDRAKKIEKVATLSEKPHKPIKKVAEKRYKGSVTIQG